MNTKKRLRESLVDIAQGSLGHCKLDLGTGDDNPMGLLGCMGLEDWFRWIQAVKVRHGGAVHEHAFALYNMHRFETLDEAVELLWEARNR